LEEWEKSLLQIDIKLEVRDMAIRKKELELLMRENALRREKEQLETRRQVLMPQGAAVAGGGALSSNHG
jgi:hypothetical protein